MALDPYKILKISRDAPDEVIRAAYKVLASKYHPDKIRVMKPLHE